VIEMENQIVKDEPTAPKENATVPTDADSTTVEVTQPVVPEGAEDRTTTEKSVIDPTKTEVRSPPTTGEPMVRDPKPLVAPIMPGPSKPATPTMNAGPAA
jgi:hypothetical protein